MSTSERCTCGETACESELCDCDARPCPVDHSAEGTGVSARDRFIKVLRSRGVKDPGLEWVVDANFNAFAHELAERIRNEPSPRDPDDYVGLVDQGADWAADLIDPEVLNSDT